MSVDFYECDCCEESRYSEYVKHCSRCGHSLCTSCVGNDDIESRYAHDYQVKYDGSEEQHENFPWSKKGYEIGDIIDDSGIDEKYCPFCSGNKYTDSDLLRFWLNKTGVVKDEVITCYLKDKKTLK